MQNRTGHLINGGDNSDLEKGQAIVFAQDRVDCRKHRLHDIVEKMSTTHSEDYGNKSSFRLSIRIVVRYAHGFLTPVGNNFLTLKIIASKLKIFKVK